MRTMTDPQAGTRAHRIQVVRTAIASYRAWIEDDQALDPPFATFGELVTCATWLLQTLEAGPAEAPDALGRANTAIAHLTNKECRDALSAVALRRPALVLDAIAEAGHE